MEHIEKIRKKRSVVRVQVTILVQKLEKELSDLNINVEVVEENVILLRQKEALLVGLDQKIEDAIQDSDEFEAEITSAQEYQDRISLWITRANRRITKPEDNHQTERLSESSNEVDWSRSAQAVKLPKLTIKKFDGDVGCWQDFWSQYEVAIHQNGSLNKPDKFNYLKSYLEGEAASAITSMALSNENYDKAIELLQQRFGRKDLIINSHMSKLLN